MRLQLPNSGSMWMPDDAIGHYRHLFGYEFLIDEVQLMTGISEALPKLMMRMRAQRSSVKGCLAHK